MATRVDPPAVADDGAGPEGPVPAGPARARGPRPGAALAVLGIAVVIVLGGVVASALLSGGTAVGTLRSVTLPDGTTVALRPGPVALRSLVGQGQPPGDVIGNLVVPSAARPTGTVDDSRGTGTYDRTASFTSGLAQTQVVAVERTALSRLGWQIVYTGPARSATGTEVLAKHGSGDGYYWEVGVVVSPTTSVGETPFSLELFQLADDTT